MKKGRFTTPWRTGPSPCEWPFSAPETSDLVEALVPCSLVESIELSWTTDWLLPPSESSSAKSLTPGRRRR